MSLETCLHFDLVPHNADECNEHRNGILEGKEVPVCACVCGFRQK